jgi:16S rRNA (adenine1518-N6/adenine1519-N6)-dimethyltransferase
MSRIKKITRQELRDLRVRPSKERGQNFVIEPYVIEEIINCGEFHTHDSIIEIGPGLGALTGELARASRLHLIEIEPKFADDLSQRYPSAEVVNEDVREVDFSRFGPGPHVVFGNLPYSFSTDILFHLIEQRKVLSRATLLLQKEFAARVASPPGSRTYGVLSIMVQLWAEVGLGTIIPGDAFHPPTKVDSQILTLRFSQEPKISAELIDLFGLVVRLSFLQRRKKIFNSLSACGHFDDNVLVESFTESGISPDSRAEALGIEEFEKLTTALKKRIVLPKTSSDEFEVNS